MLVDEQNVQNLNVAWLRRNIGYVGQQPVLFAGTVRQNILLGKPDATEAEILEAAKAANASAAPDAVPLPKNLTAVKKRTVLATHHYHPVT